MKRILLLSTLFLLASAQISFAQSSSGNHVLIEEFNSSNCPPCVRLDPQLEELERENLGDACFLKWHQNFPEANEDPFYNNQTSARVNYYGFTGIPQAEIQGTGNLTTGPQAGYIYYWPVPALNDSIQKYLGNMPSYYQMSVKHAIVGDSVIVWTTVITGDSVPSAGDLQLGVVLAQRFAQWRGANGQSFQDDIVRTAIPPLNSDGSLNSPFSQPPHDTVVYRYATLAGNWDLTELVAVAFIQSQGTAGSSPKPVYQSAWDAPQIVLSDDGANGLPAPILAGDVSSQATYTLKNNGASAATVTVTAALTSAGNYTLNVAGLTTGTSSGTVTIPAGGTVTLTASVASNGAAKTAPEYSIIFRTSDSLGIGGGAEVAFGKDIPIAVVNKWTEANKATVTSLISSITNSSYGAVGQIYDESFQQLFGYGAPNDWSQFKTVFYDDGYNDGILDLLDTSLITTFLNSGGHFAMCSPEFPYIWGAYYPHYGLQTNAWMENVFHIDHYNITSTTFSVVNGVANDPISNGISKLSVPASLTGTTETFYPIDDSAHGVFTDPNNDTVATRATSNGGKVYYSSFEIGGISSAPKRDANVKAIMDWFYSTSSGVNNPESSTFALDAAYPDPLTTSTASTIGYTIPDHRFVTLIVRDMMGREIATLVNSDQDAGHHTVPFNTMNLANGTYVYSITAGDFKADGKLTIDR